MNTTLRGNRMSQVQWHWHFPFSRGRGRWLGLISAVACDNVTKFAPRVLSSRGKAEDMLKLRAGEFEGILITVCRPPEAKRPR